LQVRSIVDFSAIASSGEPMLCTSDKACRNCFHGTTVLTQKPIDWLS